MPPGPGGPPPGPGGPQAWGPGGPPPGVPGKKSNSGLIVVLVLLGVAVVGAGAFFLLSGDDDDTASPTGTVESFLNAALADDCDAMVGTLNEAGYSAVWGGDTREAALENCEADPEDDDAEYTIESTEVTSETETSASVTANLNVTSGDIPPQVSFSLANEDGSWLISGVAFGEAPDSGGGSTDTTLPGGVEPPDISVPDITVPDITIDDGSSGGSGGSALPASPPPSSLEEDCLGSVSTCEQHANDCYDGDMEACDELYSVAGSGTPLEDYSYSCGGRTTDRVVCVDEFGPFV